MTPLLALAVAAALGACSGDDERSRGGPPPAPSGEQPAAPPVPDGGVREGHGAEDEAPPPQERGSIVVPETDPTPPRPVVQGRARVSIRARLTCRSTGGKLTTRPLVRYVPPPQIVRIRIAPGTRTRTELRRTVTQRFDTKCMGGTLERFSGEAWADTTNASGLDSTSKHIHFASR